MTDIQLYQPEMLTNLESRLSKLKSHFEKIKTSENDSELEEAVKAYNKTLKDFKDLRMPLTKKFDEIKSKFTSIENQVQECIDLVKHRRNVLAKIEYQKQRIEEEKQRQLQIEAEAKIKEESDKKLAEIQSIVLELNQWKVKIVKALTTVTPENYQEKLKALHNIPTTIESSIDVTEYERDKEDFKQQAINEIQFIKDMPEDQKQSYLSKFVEEIMQISDQIIEAKTYEENHNVLIKKTEIILDSVANDVDIKTPNVIKIVVENKAAYKALVAYWFEVIFPDYEKEIGTKTINSMIIDLERHAKQTGKRLNVVGLKYNEEFSVR